MCMRSTNGRREEGEIYLQMLLQLIANPVGIHLKAHRRERQIGRMQGGADRQLLLRFELEI